MTLQSAKAAVQKARQDGDLRALARALVTCGQLEPVFRHRAEPARTVLLEAGRILADLVDPLLEGLCLLRLAEVQMIEGLLDQAEALQKRAALRFAELEAEEEAQWAACLRVRLLFRLTKRDEAEKLLAETAVRIAALGREHAHRHSLAALSLATAEGQLDAQDPAGIDTLRQLLRSIDKLDRSTDGADDKSGEDFLDARFAAHQGIALLAQLTGHQEQAVSHLRQALALVRNFDAPLDLLECRLALGTGLAAAGKLSEARLVLQVVVDQARDLGQPEMRALGFTGLATVLSEQGAYRGGVDMAIQSAVEYSQRGNLLGYVRSVTLAAHILLSNKREAQAIEMFMYGAAALRHTVGEDAARLLDVQLEGLREEFGAERYEQLCGELRELRAARKRLEKN